MSLYSFANDHITPRGGIKTPFFETEATRVTKFPRFGNPNMQFLEKELKEGRL